MTLATEFILRFLSDRPVRNVNGVVREKLAAHALDRKTKLMLFGLALSSIAIFIRWVVRQSCNFAH